ncbi:putative colanic acid biosynthesis acetyltransferase [Spirosoma foliorum]|uniref:Putative colanic acid biosynthesis acetyltransferase n=1 Tax=Spirosoma foliorum TaxID=2710596 RepID=A0A7G5GYN7_9BACT|nr:putative colanic acid biosynthesis acetyltransferase [Spirosoma foliorum]QMW03979.1 putative colanic acid biosynthesis acetyltransferase [Spirosoma foliorum]
MYNTDAYIRPSFSIENRLARVIWHIFYLFLFKFSPRTFHGWRSFILRCFGAKVGRGVRVYSDVKIWAPWNLVLNDECIVGDGAILYSQAKIIIGYRAVVSQGSHLCTGTHDYTSPSFPLLCTPIEVGDFAWIAAEAFVHPGVSIGEGCVIGARSVVTNNMPTWSVCYGHPCKPVKARIMNY